MLMKNKVVFSLIMLLVLAMPVLANGGGTPVPSNPQYVDPVFMTHYCVDEYINITWSPQYDALNTVIIEHNFTGTPSNDTVWTGSIGTPLTVNVPYTFCTNQSEKTYYWKSYAHETNGYYGISSTYTFYINSTGFAESTYPTYSNIESNATIVDEIIRLGVDWSSYQLETGGQYMFSTNFTGSWVNQSWSNFTSTPETVAYETTLPSEQGVYAWCVYAKDNIGNENNTMCDNPIIQNVYLEENCDLFDGGINATEDMWYLEPTIGATLGNIVKFPLPETTTVDNATVCFYIYDQAGSNPPYYGNTDTRILLNDTWVESDMTIAWIKLQSFTSTITMTPSSTAKDTWECYDVTENVSYVYGLGYDSYTIDSQASSYPINIANVVEVGDAGSYQNDIGDSGSGMRERYGSEAPLPPILYLEGGSCEFGEEEPEEESPYDPVTASVVALIPLFMSLGMIGIIIRKGITEGFTIENVVTIVMIVVIGVVLIAIL